MIKTIFVGKLFYNKLSIFYSPLVFGQKFLALERKSWIKDAFEVKIEAKKTNKTTLVIFIVLTCLENEHWT